MPMIFSGEYRLRLILTSFAASRFYHKSNLKSGSVFGGQASGMRIGEVLKLKARDVQDRKLIVHDPKSGKEHEIIFIPQKVADRLKEYIRVNDINLHERIFPICYEAARTIVRKAGHLVGIHLRPHDLRRYAATYASRCGVPLEIVSKVILRHSNLATTQMYLGKISDAEAMKWIENMNG